MMETLRQWQILLNTGHGGNDQMTKAILKNARPTAYENEAKSGSFKSWSRKFKDWVETISDDAAKLITIGEGLTEAVVPEVDIPVGLATVDRQLHQLIRQSLEGEAELLSINALVGDLGNQYKSVTELWRLLVHNFERKSAYNPINVLQMIRKMTKANTLDDVLPKM